MATSFDEKTRVLLSRPLPAILATVSPRGQPQATPVWYLLENGHILINTSEGRVKLRNLEANPFLSLTVVDPDNIYRYVQVRGRVARFDSEGGARDIDRLSQRYTGRPYRYPPTDRPDRRVSILIEPLAVPGMGL